ncbi:MAG TPA: hypothetical protein VGD53_05395 [Actinoallomurus sp.]
MRTASRDGGAAGWTTGRIGRARDGRVFLAIPLFVASGTRPR